MSAHETSARGLAWARAALAGNPSDGYGGAVLAVTVPAFRAEAAVRRVDGELDVYPCSELVEATVRRFGRSFSARAQRTGEELGIAAGLQDRVAQAHGGLTFMDFGAGGRYEPMPPSLLPPLLVAWRPDAAQESDDVHRALRILVEHGDVRVSEAMAELAELARSARSALFAGDRRRLAAAVDGSFDVRQRMVSLDPRHVEMVECARALGASANFTGSGGAIVAVCRDQQDREQVSRALDEIGCQTVELQVEGE